jgi:hypothetical protein
MEGKADRDGAGSVLIRSITTLVTTWPALTDAQGKEDRS